jgi:hypothetical protein
MPDDISLSRTASLDGSEVRQEKMKFRVGEIRHKGTDVNQGMCVKWIEQSQEITDRMRRPAIVVNSPVVFITFLQISMSLEVKNCFILPGTINITDSKEDPEVVHLDRNRDQERTYRNFQHEASGY